MATKYILNGKEYRFKDITFELICQDIASRKDAKAKKYLLDHKDEIFVSLRKGYLEAFGVKAPTEKDKALELLNW